ncbi:hypothetical protein HNQ40_003012 [Algisphaera agarilytica]|uniref:Uncharacterized protein n=1 Tax=Algisphaera agarilytica TaxID=1385975 RepID=A0A7X0LM24_9BACT|nr:hypothetical protein [Algisphaera agarilytica]
MTLALAALVSLSFALFSFKGLVAAVGLSAAAWFEFRGYAKLRRLDPQGVTILTRNQVGLTVLIVGYCLWCLADAWFGPDPYEKVVSLRPELAQPLEPYAGIFRQMVVMIYVIVLAVSLPVQALVIRYYATRRGNFRAYLDQTPGWVLRWNRAELKGEVGEESEFRP